MLFVHYAHILKIESDLRYNLGNAKKIRAMVGVYCYMC